VNTSQQARAEHRYLADRGLTLAEHKLERAVRAAMADWLTAARNTVLYNVARGAGTITAAGYPNAPSAVDSITTTFNNWRRALGNTILPEVSVVFGEAFNQVRRENEYNAYQWQQDYLATVNDRLVIWPEGAFEELRPELLEAMAEGESLDQIKDRVGMILKIDAPTRAVRARISEIDRELADPDLDPARAQALRARRRALWEQHDQTLGEWEWKARRIARTEAQGARNGGSLAAARAMEIATGQTFYKEWVSTLDTRTRLTHRVADGQIVKLSAPFLVGGFPLRHPGDHAGPGREVINCRCSLRVHDDRETQRELQGHEGSIGKVTPGGRRLGPDDPDEARAAVEQLADEEERYPGPDLRSDEDVPAPVPPTPERVPDRALNTAPLPDVTKMSEDELIDLMDEAYAAENWRLFDHIEAELIRRDGLTAAGRHRRPWNVGDKASKGRWRRRVPGHLAHLEQVDHPALPARRAKSVQEFRELTLAPDDQPDLHADSDAERQFLRDELRGRGSDHVTVQRTGRKSPDFASRSSESALEHKKPAEQPADQAALNTSVHRNARRASYQSRDVILDYRDNSFVTTERAKLALGEALNEPDTAPYLDGLAIRTGDGGVNWRRDRGRAADSK
jgi:hypothetical protein